MSHDRKPKNLKCCNRADFCLPSSIKIHKFSEKGAITNILIFWPHSWVTWSEIEKSNKKRLCSPVSCVITWSFNIVGPVIREATGKCHRQFEFFDRKTISQELSDCTVHRLVSFVKFQNRQPKNMGGDRKTKCYQPDGWTDISTRFIRSFRINDMKSFKNL